MHTLVEQNEVQTTDTIPFDDAVAEGKELKAKIADAERSQLRLGELAAKLEPKYGDRTLAKFAAEIGIDKNTLNNYRTVYRAWEGKLPPGVKSPSFTVLKELQNVAERAELIKKEPTMSKRRAEVHRVLKDHPGRDEIRNENPNLTCTKQTRKLMEKYDATESGVNAAVFGRGSGGGDKYSQRWFNKVLALSKDVKRETAVADQDLTPEQQAKLLRAVEPALTSNIREAGLALIKLADRLDALCEEQSPEVLAALRALSAAETNGVEHKRRATDEAAHMGA
jgi:hypothetical protein